MSPYQFASSEFPSPLMIRQEYLRHLFVATAVDKGYGRTKTTSFFLLAGALVPVLPMEASLVVTEEQVMSCRCRPEIVFEFSYNKPSTSDYPLVRKIPAAKFWRHNIGLNRIVH